MGLSDHGENAMLGMMKQAGTFYLALFTQSPDESGGGTEMAGGGYARQQVSFGTPSGGVMRNDAAIVFPTATSDWGTATGWGLFDAASGGNLWWYGDIDTPKELFAGDIYRVNVGGLSLVME